MSRVWVHFNSVLFLGAGGGGNDIQWCFSQVKGAVDDDVAEGKNVPRVNFLKLQKGGVFIILKQGGSALEIPLFCRDQQILKAHWRLWLK